MIVRFKQRPGQFIEPLISLLDSLDSIDLPLPARSTLLHIADRAADADFISTRQMVRLISELDRLVPLPK